MNLQQIQFFLGLAAELHFSNTANQMNITQSALSRQIQALESELGFALFERSKRKVQLTPAGRFLQQEWHRLSGEIGNVHRHAQLIADGEAGQLFIGHPGSAIYSVIPDLLINLKASYPKLKVDLAEMNEDRIEQSLLGYQIDLGFKRSPARPEKLQSEKLFGESMMLVVGEAHPLNQDTFTSLEQTRYETFIQPSINGVDNYALLLQSIFREAGFIPNISYESHYGSTILHLVARGLGISLLPQAYALYAPPGVRFIPLPYTTYLYAIWRKNDHNPLIMKLLSETRSITAKKDNPLFPTV